MQHVTMPKHLYKKMLEQTVEGINKTFLRPMYNMVANTNCCRNM